MVLEQLEDRSPVSTVGRRLAISGERARQLEARVLSGLRDFLEARVFPRMFALAVVVIRSEQQPAHPSAMFTISSNGATPGTGVLWASMPKERRTLTMMSGRVSSWRLMSPRR